MALDQVDIALPEIAYSGGRKELVTIKEISVEIKDPKTPVMTMNRKRRAIGRTRGVPTHDVSLTVAQLKGTPEVDWLALLSSGEEFQFNYEEGDGGRRYSLDAVTVDEVSKPFKESGETFFSVKCTALDHRLEQ